MNRCTAFSVWILLLLGISSCKEDNQPKNIVLEELTIEQIHQAYREGLYNSYDLVSAYLAAIKEFDPEINAITIINPNALKAAQALDEEYQKTKELRPLHGIPIIVKDNINTVGLPTTAGALALQDFIPDENAFVINPGIVIRK